MATLEQIVIHGEYLVDKLKRGEILNQEENNVLKIYNSLYKKKSANSGKRKGSSKIQKVK